MLLYAVLAGLAVYLALFMVSPYQWAERKYTRGGYAAAWLLLPDEVVGAWLDSPADLLLLDRALPLAVVGAIVAVAGLAGYLTLVALRIDGELSALEQVFFAEAVGLNLVSTWTLAVGLLGGLHNPAWFILPAMAVVAGAVWVLRGRGRKAGPLPPFQPEPAQGDIHWLNHHWLWLGTRLPP